MVVARDPWSGPIGEEGDRWLATSPGRCASHWHSSARGLTPSLLCSDGGVASSDDDNAGMRLTREQRRRDGEDDFFYLAGIGVITSSVGLVSVAGVAAKVSADLILPHHRWKLRAAVAGGGGQEARAQLTGRCVLLDSRVPCRAPQQPCSATTSSLATRSQTSSTSAHHDGLRRLQRALLKSGSCALRMSSHRRCSLPPPT
jgi:hypothetical protein